jgi:hypothetical protein
MRNKNNTETDGRKTRTAEHVELAVLVFLLAAVSFACGYFVATAQIAAMMAQ